VDSERKSRSTSSVLTGEDECLYSEEVPYTKSVGCRFHRIFLKIEDVSFTGLVGDALRRGA
jgi:hypothetical protein